MLCVSRCQVANIHCGHIPAGRQEASRVCRWEALISVYFSKVIKLTANGFNSIEFPFKVLSIAALSPDAASMVPTFAPAKTDGSLMVIDLFRLLSISTFLLPVP